MTKKRKNKNGIHTNFYLKDSILMMCWFLQTRWNEGNY